MFNQEYKYSNFNIVNIYNNNDKNLISDNKNKKSSKIEFFPKQLSCKVNVLEKTKYCKAAIKIIETLRLTYDQFVIEHSQKQAEIDKRKSGIYGEGFFDVIRLPLPKFKENADAYYKLWGTFLAVVHRFFDGQDLSSLIKQIHTLEQKINERVDCLSTDSDHTLSKESILLEILQEFEIECGFSEIVHIHKENDLLDKSNVHKGILKAEDFLAIIADGHPLNDFGAAPQHGPYSHRLQFYLLGNFFLKHRNLFFNEETFCLVKTELLKQNPSWKDETDDTLTKKMVPVFYRLLGDKNFNDSLDWDAFEKIRYEENKKVGQENAPKWLNSSYIWTQLFDRFGYRGFFSVPSTFGFLQKLGCFPDLPKIGKPNLKGNVYLREIIEKTKEVIMFSS